MKSSELTAGCCRRAFSATASGFRSLSSIGSSSGNLSHRTNPGKFHKQIDTTKWNEPLQGLIQQTLSTSLDNPGNPYSSILGSRKNPSSAHISVTLSEQQPSELCYLSLLLIKKYQNRQDQCSSYCRPNEQGIVPCQWCYTVHKY